VAQVREWLPKFDGVMIGRQIYHEPYLLAELDAHFLGPGFVPPSREEVVDRYADYVERMLAGGPSPAASCCDTSRASLRACQTPARGAATSRNTRSGPARDRRCCGIPEHVPQRGLADHPGGHPLAVLACAARRATPAIM